MSRAASHLQAAVMSAVAWISNLSSTVSLSPSTITAKAANVEESSQTEMERKKKKSNLKRRGTENREAVLCYSFTK